MPIHSIAVAVLALALGALGGFALARTAPEADPALAEALAFENAQLASKVEALEGRLEQADAEARRLEALARAAEERVAGVDAKDLDEATPDEGFDMAALVESLVPEDVLEDDRGEEADDDSNPGRGRFGNVTEEQRQDFRQRFREGVQGFLAVEYERVAADPVAADRISAMAEYTDYLMDLRGQMRDAEDDETREALAEAFRTGMEEARSLVDEHRAYLLRETIEGNGIDDPLTQRRLTRDIQATLESPFFQRGFGGRGVPGAGFRVEVPNANGGRGVGGQ